MRGVSIGGGRLGVGECMKNHNNTMSYHERLKHYEEEKALLKSMGLDPFEYEKLLRKAAEKWRV